MHHKGFFLLVLHAHLPYVRHPREPGVMEERWLFEAITECYVPLLKVFEQLAREGVKYKVTLSLSPPLVSMLTDRILQERYTRYLNSLILLSEMEIERNRRNPPFESLARMYNERLNEVRRAFEEEYSYNLLLPVQSLQALGFLEVITTCATHGYLPLMLTEEAKRAQVHVAVEQYTGIFGRPPQGMWLPECGYAKGVDSILKDYGIRYFFMETHGITNARPAPHRGIYAPVFCPSGVAAFGRDPESSRQVWDRHTGYPGDYFYREFYRDIGYDLPLHYLSPFLPGGTIRCDTGIKYYRITGRGEEKEPYNPDIAEGRTVEHARDFAQKRALQCSRLSSQIDREPLVVAPYDAELFGHWWYEGPRWLFYLAKALSSSEYGVEMITPAEYLALYPDNQVVEPAESSWGEGGYNQVWLNPANDWIYRHLHRAESAMSDLAGLHPAAQGVKKRALNQAARELLLAQSSDWAFIIKTGTAVQYAVQRITGHIENFNKLAAGILNDIVDGEELSSLELADNIFPEIDYSVYSRYYRSVKKWFPTLKMGKNLLRVLMLSWEFPPRTIGGLSRHVYDLTRALTRLGCCVHVVTCPVGDRGTDEVVDGVFVYRLDPRCLWAQDFLEWVDQMNAAMDELARDRWKGGDIDVVHAHDWLVGKAASKIAERLKVPLVATIHATEYGRNRGLFNETQRYIHAQEKFLAELAGKVICCSRYMRDEITGLFGVPPQKLHIIPNGVDPLNLGVPASLLPVKKDFVSGKKIFFIGRLVPEKGVQVLLEAFAQLVVSNPGLKLFIGGRGPYEPFLRERAAELGLGESVVFLGYLDETGRNSYLKQVDVAVFPSLYEPFGIVALEAMAAQVPVIVSDTGGLSEVVSHGIDGFKVPPGRPDILAYYIGEVLNNPVLARDLARGAWRKIITVYNWQHIALQTLDVYGEILGLHSL